VSGTDLGNSQVLTRVIGIGLEEPVRLIFTNIALHSCIMQQPSDNSTVNIICTNNINKHFFFAILGYVSFMLTWTCHNQLMWFLNTNLTQASCHVEFSIIQTQRQTLRFDMYSESLWIWHSLLTPAQFCFGLVIYCMLVKYFSGPDKYL